MPILDAWGRPVTLDLTPHPIPRDVPTHRPWVHPMQVEDGVSKFTTRDTGKTDNGIPIREAVEPYFRWYCACGSIGGRSKTAEAAATALVKHMVDADD